MTKLKRCPFCGGEAKITKPTMNTVNKAVKRPVRIGFADMGEKG